MGTVGLSFGSPTSGAGFDVSSTVSQIVSNMQNVETPWKTQLTSLQSQDSVISNLGSLFSALSTDMSTITDFEGTLAQKVGSSSDTNVLQLTAANSTATAGTHSVVVNNLAQTASGYLDKVANAADALTGSITIQTGSGTAQTVTIGAAPSSPNANTIYTGSGNNTLAKLASAINSANLGVTANVLTDSTGSRLSIVSNTSGAAGATTITSALTDANLVTKTNSTGAINYNPTAGGKDASLEIDGVPLTSASNTVSNLIPGVTFQLLAPSAQESDSSLEAVQVIIGNDNSGVETAVNQLVTDYNSLISAVTTQEGNDSSGKAEPLFGSPTLGLLQQQLLSGLNMRSPSGTLDAVSVTPGTTLTGSINIKMAGGLPLDYSGTAGSSTQASTGTLSPLPNANDALSGSMSIQVGSGNATSVTMDEVNSAEGGTTLADLESYINSNSSTLGVTASIVTNGSGRQSLSLLSATAGSAGTLTVNSGIADTATQTIAVPTSQGNNTLAGLADAISAAGIGVTAAVVTVNGQSTLTLASQVEGSSGVLQVASGLVSVSPTALSFLDAGSETSTSPDTGTLNSVTGSGDALTGSLSIQVGGGKATTVTMDQVNSAQGGTTLANLEGYINNNSSTLGVTATIVDNADGSESLSLISGTNGSAGALEVTASLYDTTHPTSTALNYNPSSDITSLTTLGISVNNDGSLTLDANALDTLLNTDYSGVVGFFQNANSWGQNFSHMLNQAGTSSSTGILKLAQNSNSNIEKTLNAEVAKEDSYIATQKTKLTAELNQANQIMQELPSQLSGMDELYAAITGYNQNRG